MAKVCPHGVEVRGESLPCVECLPNRDMLQRMLEAMPVVDYRARLTFSPPRPESAEK